MTVHTALFPRGPVRLTRPVLNHVMHASWDKHLLRIKEIPEMGPGGQSESAGQLED